MSIVKIASLILALAAVGCSFSLKKLNFDTHSMKRMAAGQFLMNNGDNEMPEKLKLKLQEYLSLRVDDIEKLPRNITITEREGRKEESFMVMFKPAGWYKDTTESDLQSRSNKRAPIINHPLAYAELKKFGYERYTSDIMQYGGPHVVGKKVGLEWEEVKVVWDEKLRPTRTESYAFDMQGSLRLGGALDQQLSAAETMDMTELKETMAAQQQRSTDAVAVGSGVAVRDYNEDYQRLTASKFKDWGDDDAAADGSDSLKERFSLTTKERIYLVLVSLVSAVGWGRATNDAVHTQVWAAGIADELDIAKGISLALLAVSLLSAVGSAVLASQKGKNTIIWFSKGLLGGASVPLLLSQLPTSSVTSSTTDISANSEADAQ